MSLKGVHWCFITGPMKMNFDHLCADLQEDLLSPFIPPPASVLQCMSCLRIISASHVVFRCYIHNVCHWGGESVDPRVAATWGSRTTSCTGALSGDAMEKVISFQMCLKAYIFSHVLIIKPDSRVISVLACASMCRSAYVHWPDRHKASGALELKWHHETHDETWC